MDDFCSTIFHQSDTGYKKASFSLSLPSLPVTQCCSPPSRCCWPWPASPPPRGCPPRSALTAPPPPASAATARSQITQNSRLVN